MSNLKIYDLYELRKNKDFLDYLKKNFEIISYKIKNNYIKIRNIESDRTYLKTIINTLNGCISEYIVCSHLRNNLENEIIDYDEVRSDGYKYPDMFDVLVLPKGVNKYKVIEYLKNETKNIKNFNDFRVKKEKIHSLFKQIGIHTIEIKSSTLSLKSNDIESEIERKPFIVYSLNKEEVSGFTRKPLLTENERNDLTSNDRSKIFKKIEFNNFLSRIYPSIKNNNIRKFLFSQENPYLSDFNINVFYSKIGKLNNPEMKDISFEDCFHHLSRKFYFNSMYTNRERLTNKTTSVGRTSISNKALYQINEIKRSGIMINHISDDINRQRIYITIKEQKEFIYSREYDFWFCSENNKIHFCKLNDNKLIERQSAHILTIDTNKNTIIFNNRINVDISTRPIQQSHLNRKFN